VEIAFVKDAMTAFPSGQGSPDPSAFYTTDTKKVKCNEALREDFCRYFSTRERNCEGPWFAERYAYSYLFKCLKDLYQGEIVITGDPALKPYDQVFLYDTYNDMAGAVEVEQVTHIFSQETGFVTAITPGFGGAVQRDRQHGPERRPHDLLHQYLDRLQQAGLQQRPGGGGGPGGLALDRYA
jgi:hypothetical protein